MFSNNFRIRRNERRANLWEMNEGGGGDRSSRSTSPETEVTKSRDEISNSSTNGDSAKKQKSVKRYCIVLLVYFYGHPELP